MTHSSDRPTEPWRRKVGARGLRMILEELMLDLMYHLPQPEEGRRNSKSRARWWKSATFRLR